jgi:hypothetical protein
VAGQCGWPDREREVTFDGHRLILLPRTRDKSASIHIEMTGLAELEAMTIINRFCSLVSWTYKDSLATYDWGFISPSLQAIDKPNPATTVNPGFLPAWAGLTPRQQLAVALYREACSSDSLPYEFLGYFKILNVLYATGPKQCRWIEAVLPKLTDRLALEQLAVLRKKVTGIPTYLYESGRCAVAHANTSPVVDPDDLSDLRRLSEALQVMRALAEYCISNELHVPDLR